MKIDDPLKKAAGLSVNTTPTRAGKASEQGNVSKVPPQSDNVTLSNQVQELAAQVSTSSVFDTKKVEEIKAAIANGQFQVNAESVADGLMDTVKDLISTRRG
ncbi:MAG TPA: flagellar biosynthesis anti-sigma factor FlgM [Oxalicibacterium sp.]|nr:flagellar biosynthesis anti-sigma factor FlgM [Oxalicibacterium sp.]